MKNCRFATMFLCSLLIATATACDDDLVTDPIVVPESGTLLVDRLAVSVVPTGHETVIVQALTGAGETIPFTAELEDPTIASIVVGEDDVEVTGEEYGSTVLTIHGPSDSIRRIPITVYDPIEVDFGEIRLRYWTEFGEMRGYWSEDDENCYYHPDFSGDDSGWFALGSMVLREGEAADRHRVMLVARLDDDADPAHPPLVIPTGYQSDSWSDNGEYLSRAAYYRPLAPEGYSALGEVVRFRDDSPPSEDEVVCVRDDLVHFGEVQGSSYSMYMERDPLDVQQYHLVDEIVPITAPPHETAYLPINSFATFVINTDGNDDPVVNVLELGLPVVAQSEEQLLIPRLTSIHAPPDQSLPTMHRAILTPYTTITDPEYAGREEWQIANSPFYRLEREVYYKLLYYNYNQTSVEQENKIEIVSGSTTSRSEAFWNESGVSVSKEVGVMVGVKKIANASGKYSVNVSRKLGYATMTNVQELREEHTTTTVYTAPGKAAAMWQKYNRFTLKRHVDNRTEIVSVYEFGINEFITDEYPD